VTPAAWRAHAEALRASWAAWPAERKRAALAALAVAIVAIAVLIGRAATQPRVPLAEGLYSDQLNDLAAVLASAGVEHSIDGTAIFVNQDDLGAARAAIVGDPAEKDFGGVADIPMALTPTALDFALKRATEQRMASQIARMDGVAGAWVQIVAPERAIFANEVQLATASVFLQLRAGVSLSAAQVRGIAALVANGVPDLTPERVTVVDHHGALLASGSGGPGAETDLADQQRRAENAVTDRVRAQLVSVLGFDGAFTVTASVDLDPSEQRSEQETVDPDRVVPLSEETEETRSSTAGPSGVPGVEAVLAERPTGSERSSGEETSKTVTTFGVSRSSVTVVRPAGAIRRVSVGVAVDAARLGEAAKGVGVEPAALLAQIESIARAAMGFDAARGDAIRVEAMPFAPLPEPTEATPMAAALADGRLAEAGVAALGLVLLFAFVVRPLVKSATTPTAVTAVATADLPEAADSQPTDDDLAERLRRLVDSAQPLDAADLTRLVVRESNAATTVARRWAQTA
jgi:flagellar M-ring protein FliF